ncbi:MAG TPA: glycosyltransferase [Pirellulales bacterium]|nr:glycosyltransferase [Pirellulales bacterium]
MRIGIDMIAVQRRPHSAVGRYVLGIVQQLTTRFSEHEWFLYFHEALDGADSWCGATSVQLRSVATHISRGDIANGQLALEQSNDKLDLWLTTSTLDCLDAYAPPSAPIDGVRLAGLVYDLAPALVADRFVQHPGRSQRYQRALQTLPRYDLLLTVSEATRRDLIRSFGIDERRVATIGPAASSALELREPISAESPAALDSLRIRNPFVLFQAGDHEDRSVQVFSAAVTRLPAAVADRFQFVIACRLPGERQAAWQAEFARQGRSGRMLLIDGELDDMRQLYQHCEAFVDVSPHEGSGLALLDALPCGAAIIVDRRSWHAEMAAEAALLADVDQPADLAAKLDQLLCDETMQASLRLRAPLVASRFSLAAAADRAMEALDDGRCRVGPARLRAPAHHRRSWWAGARKLAGPTLRSTSDALPKHPQRPTLAFFSPLLPQRTGISDYSERLLAALARHYWIDLYHDHEYLPQLSLSNADFACRDHRLFDRFRRASDYAGIVYQMANTHYCAYLYDMLLKQRGVVVLHDYALPEFHFGYALRAGVPDDFIAGEIAFESAELGHEYRSNAEAWRAEPGGIVQACVRRGLTFNRRVLEAAAVLVVHDRWGAEQIARAHPQIASRVRVIPHGASVTVASPDEKRALRHRFGFADDDLILSCFGLLNGAKYHAEAIEALAALSREFPSARLIFAGGDMNEGREPAAVERLGLGNRVRFFGHAPIETFLDLMSITDVAMNLRRPPTRGETSGALLSLLSAGVPTIVTDVDTFASYPDNVVYKIGALAPADRSLENALRSLLDQTQRRREMGRAAVCYVAEIHNWQRVASLYAEAVSEAREALGRQAA